MMAVIACHNRTQKDKPPPDFREIRFTMPGTRDIPYKIGKDYRYVFQYDNVEIGIATFRIEQDENNGYRITSTLDSDDSFNSIYMNSNSELLLDENLNPLSYKREMDAKYADQSHLNGHYSMKITFSENEAILKYVEPGVETHQYIEQNLPDGIFVFDNNHIGQMALICSQPYLRSGRREFLNILSTKLKTVTEIAMTAKIKHDMKFAGSSVIAYEVDMKADMRTFGNYFITPDGILIKAKEEGDRLVVELLNPD